MHTFQINVLIQFFASSACFEHLPADEHMMFETCRRHQELI